MASDPATVGGKTKCEIKYRKVMNKKVSDLGSPVNFNNAYMQDGQFLLTLEMTNYFANRQDHAMKEKQITVLHHHSLLSEDIS